MNMPRISLEQWAAFKAVVDEGSFAQAAEALNKSQSSISYALARLNEQLPTPVLRIQGRKATLTEEGKLMYRRATQLLQHAEEAEETARMLARGLEAELTIAVDALLETSALIPVLQAFSKEYPLTRLRILETSLSGTDEALLERRANLVIAPRVPVGFMGTPLATIRMIAVARADHPLVVRSREEGFTGITDWELRSHLQIVLRDTGVKREQDGGWLGSEQRWTVSHFSSSVSILKSGVGFAFLPLGWIREELEAGTLVPLKLVLGAERMHPLFLISGSPETDRPAACAMSARLIAFFRARPEDSVPAGSQTP